MKVSAVALRTGLFVCALSLAGISTAGAVTWNLNSPTGDIGLTHTYSVGSDTVSATAGTLSGTTFAPSTLTSGPVLFGKASVGDPTEQGVGLDPGTDNEISGNGVVEIAFNTGTVPGSRTFSMDSVQPPDNWTVYGSSNATTGFLPISGLQNQTSQLVDTALPDFAFYLFAIGNDSGSSVLLSTLDATAVPLPPAIFLFGAALAGLGFLSRRRKEGPALQAL